jgi:hypothetical protein
MARTSMRTMTMIAMVMLPDILAVGGGLVRWSCWLVGLEAWIWVVDYNFLFFFGSKVSCSLDRLLIREERVSSGAAVVYWLIVCKA